MLSMLQSSLSNTLRDLPFAHTLWSQFMSFRRLAKTVEGARRPLLLAVQSHGCLWLPVENPAASFWVRNCLRCLASLNSHHERRHF